MRAWGEEAEAALMEEETPQLETETPLLEAVMLAGGVKAETRLLEAQSVEEVIPLVEAEARLLQPQVCITKLASGRTPT